MSYCQCEFTRNPHADPRQRRVGRRRRGVDAGRKRLVVYTVGGPGRGPVPRSDDSVEAQCEIRKSHPLPSPSPAKCRSSHPVPSSAPPASGFMAEILAVGHSGSPTAARRSPHTQVSAARIRLYGRDPRRRALRLSDSGTQITPHPGQRRPHQALWQRSPPSGTQALRQRHADHPVPSSAPPASGFMVEIPAVGHAESPTAAVQSVLFVKIEDRDF